MFILLYIMKLNLALKFCLRQDCCLFTIHRFCREEYKYCQLSHAIDSFSCSLILIVNACKLSVFNNKAFCSHTNSNGCCFKLHEKGNLIKTAEKKMCRVRRGLQSRQTCVLSFPNFSTPVLNMDTPKFI